MSRKQDSKQKGLDDKKDAKRGDDKPREVRDEPERKARDRDDDRRDDDRRDDDRRETHQRDDHQREGHRRDDYQREDHREKDVDDLFELAEDYARCDLDLRKNKLVPDLDGDGMALNLGGTASAFGENTLGDGHISAKVMDKGAYSIAIGESTFVAAAEAGAGGPAFASATSFAAATGADFVFSFTTILSTSPTDAAFQAQKYLLEPLVEVIRKSFRET